MGEYDCRRIFPEGFIYETHEYRINRSSANVSVQVAMGCKMTAKSTEAIHILSDTLRGMGKHQLPEYISRYERDTEYSDYSFD